MPEYTDLYALSARRTEERVTAFAERFLPEREETADEFEVPQFARAPEQVFRTSAELIRHCCARLSEAHTVYWRNTRDMEPAYAMVFFLPDAHVVYGLSTASGDPQLVERLLAELKDFVGAEHAYAAHEQPPAENAVEFRRLAARRRP
jgi:hypothetical protein